MTSPIPPGSQGVDSRSRRVAWGHVEVEDGRLFARTETWERPSALGWKQAFSAGVVHKTHGKVREFNAMPRRSEIRHVIEAMKTEANAERAFLVMRGGRSKS